ncbi:holo-ACP synthase [Bacillus sp. FJAT-45350]|uniref:holo-ACP synthase n=1 Tax=Bacillus sp. FJAT-45350 TaxID=2011014 RepID=UPI000BB81E4A|nr:holo-ACP synthase [Bacillus sp. FJAT-45350]
MIEGIGIDIVELSRIEKTIARQPRFVEKILTVNELNVFHALSKGRQVEYIAGRFAAKEAFVKAMGTGISKKYSWHDVEILHNENRKPILVAGVAGRLHVSISHSKEYAVAQVIIESSSS